MVNKMKRRVKKTTKIRLSLFGTLSILSIVYFCFTLCFHFYTIYDLTKQKNDLEDKYVKLQKEADDLQIEINKLNNPEYLARYAREKYSYSKEGEYIIKLNNTKNELNVVKDNLNINYVVIVLSGVIFLIFIYIISRARKKEI